MIENDIKVLKKAISEKPTYKMIILTRTTLVISILIVPFMFSFFDIKSSANMFFLGFSVLIFWLIHLLNVKIHNQFAPVAPKTIQFLNENLSDRTKDFIFGERDIKGIAILKIELFVITNALISETKIK